MAFRAISSKNAILRRARQRAALADAAGRGKLENWDYQYLSSHAGHLYRAAIWVAGLYAVAGTAYLMFSGSPQTWPFAFISFAALVCLLFWYALGRKGLPVFPMLAAQLAFLNSIPLLTGAETLNGLTASTILISAGTVALFLVILAAAWWMGSRMIESRPSRWNFAMGGGLAGRRSFKMSLALQVFSVLFQFGNISGFNARLLPGPAADFMPVLAAFAGAAGSLGAFLGGLAVARHPFQPAALLFWALLAVNCILSISSLLLYGVCGMVFACALGLGFGARRIPWIFLVIVSLTLAFLSEGKGAMRTYYWDENSGAPKVGLGQLPAFYRDWVRVSLDTFQMSHSGDSETAALGQELAGSTMAARLDNFQNLTFIVNVLEQGNAVPLYGKTYAVVPKLLIPRFLWPDKPRTHEGQIMLNLNYGRQTTEQQTENTYIAWGLLPEAVGNFGCYGGACFLGLLAGLGCGMLEAWSARKRVFSIEGLVAVALLLALAVSYEMVASVFVTATFQMLVAVLVFGWLMRAVLNPVPGRKRRPVLSNTEAGKADSGNAATGVIAAKTEPQKG